MFYSCDVSFSSVWPQRNSPLSQDKIFDYYYHHYFLVWGNSRVLIVSKWVSRYFPWPPVTDILSALMSVSVGVHWCGAVLGRSFSSAHQRPNHTHLSAVTFPFHTVLQLSYQQLRWISSTLRTELCMTWENILHFKVALAASQVHLSQRFRHSHTSICKRNSRLAKKN